MARPSLLPGGAGAVGPATLSNGCHPSGLAMLASAHQTPPGSLAHPQLVGQVWTDRKEKSGRTLFPKASRAPVSRRRLVRTDWLRGDPGGQEAQKEPEERRRPPRSRSLGATFKQKRGPSSGVEAGASGLSECPTTTTWRLSQTAAPGPPAPSAEAAPPSSPATPNTPGCRPWGSQSHPPILQMRP